MEFDLIAINLEFQELLKKHENDTEVTGVDKKAFEDVTSYHEEDKCGDEESLRKFWAMAYNAYEELCNKHQGLRETYGWYAGADSAGYPNPYDLYIGTGDEEEQGSPKRKNLAAANNKAFDGDNDYWPFLTKYMTDYDHSDRIAEIVDIEKELDESMATIGKDRFNESREELRRLTLKCLDEALCNYINKKYPGAVNVGAPKGEKEGSLLFESLVLLSADLYQTVYDSKENHGYREAVGEIVALAKQFEEELDWQEDDERDYIEELEKFEKKVLEKLEKDHD